MIKLVIFDLLGVVLVYDRKAHIRQMCKILKKDERSILETMVPLWERMEVGELNVADMKRIASKRLGVTPWKLDRINNYDSVKINTKVIDIMRSLHKHYKVVILTNLSKGSYLIARRRFLDNKAYEKAFVSAYIRMKKPDYRAYELVMDRMNVTPEESLLIDDSPINVESAKKANMDAVLFVNQNQLMRSLLQKNIRIK